MATEKVNMLLESAKFVDLQTFLRDRDNAQAIAEYVIDEGQQLSFFTNFGDKDETGEIKSKLMITQFNIDEGAGDLVKVKRFNVTRGVGLPGGYKASRQLAGSESLAGSAYREEKMSIGLHRYAVALENFIDKITLPTHLTTHIMNMLSLWWFEQDDVDNFTTLFRDYPAYYAEINSLAGADELDRVEALFGRGTFNNVKRLLVIF